MIWNCAIISGTLFELVVLKLVGQTWNPPTWEALVNAPLSEGREAGGSNTSPVEKPLLSLAAVKSWELDLCLPVSPNRQCSQESGVLSGI